MKKTLKNSLTILLSCTFALSLSSITEAAGINIWQKGMEKIGMGPSHRRITEKIPKGEMRTLSNGHTYQIIDNGMGYLPAKYYAKQLGGYLAIINDANENELLYNFMIAQGYDAAYFGLQDRHRTGTWSYDGDIEPPYTHWHHNQPDRTNISCNYAMLYKLYTQGTWKAGSFTDLDPVKGGNAFIIEWDGGAGNVDKLPTKKKKKKEKAPEPQTPRQPQKQTPSYNDYPSYGGGQVAPSNDGVKEGDEFDV